MRRYFDTVISAFDGKPVLGAQITVMQAGVPVQLYSDGVATLGQPVLTNGLGLFSFYVPDGTYTLTIRYPGNSGPVVLNDVEIYEDRRDLAVPPGEIGLTLPSSAARAGQLLGFGPSGEFKTYSGTDFTGSPGGNVQSAGPFSLLRVGATVITLATLTVRTSHHTYAGQGAAWYRRDDTLVTGPYATANPLTSFRAPDEFGTLHGYVLDEARPDLAQFGFYYSAGMPSGTIRTQNDAAVQASQYANSVCTIVAFGYTTQNARFYYAPLNANGSPHLIGIGRYNCGLIVPTTDAMTWPLFGIPELYLKGDDDSYRAPDGSLMNTGDSRFGTPTGREPVYQDFALDLGYGQNASGIFLYNTFFAKVLGLKYFGVMRAIFAAQAFETVVRDCDLVGSFYAYPGQTLANVVANFARYQGVYAGSHTEIQQLNAQGFGVALALNGSGATAATGRLEQNECAITTGGKAYDSSNWNKEAFNAASGAVGSGLPGNGSSRWEVSGFVTESCAHGHIDFSSVNAFYHNNGFTGFNGAVLGVGAYNPSRSPRSGIITWSDETAHFKACSSNLQSADIAQILNLGSARFDNCSGTMQNANGILSSFNAGFRAQATRVLFAETTNAGVLASAPSTFDTGLEHFGFNGVDNLNAKKRSTNLGGRLAFAAGATTATYTFPTQVDASAAQFSTGPTASANVAAGTNFVASGTRKFVVCVWIEGRRGKTGVSGYAGPFQPYTVTATLKEVTLAPNQSIVMTFAALAGDYRRRVGIWPADSLCVANQVYDYPATQTSVEIIGGTGGGAPWGVDQPAIIPASIPSQVEPDALFEVGGFGTNWNSGHPYITAQSATAFTVATPNAAPGGGGSLTFQIQRS